MKEKYSDDQLVSQFKISRDPTFFNLVYLRYYAKVYKVCFFYSKDPSTADDLSHDVMLKIFEKLPTLRRGDSLQAWIYKITKNECLSYLREKKWADQTNSPCALENELEMPECTEWETRETMLEELDKAVSDLNEEDRNLLLLKYFYGYSLKEIQYRFQISESALKMRLSRVRKQIFRKLHSRYFN